MRSFGNMLRGGFSSLAMAVASTALAGGLAVAVVGVAGLSAPAAVAQAKASKEFGTPMNEAVALIQAKKYNEAIPKIDQAAPFAKAPNEKLAVEQLRTAVYAGTNNRAKLLASLEAQIAIGGLPPETVKSHKRTILGLYSEMGQDAKAVQLTKEFVAAYGGSSALYAFLASAALKAGDRPGAIDNAEKAIDSARKEGKAADEKWYNIIMKAHYDGGNLDAYYAALEKAVVAFPREQYWKALIGRAEKAPKFKRQDAQLDVFRALQAAKVTLTAAELMGMGESALTRGMLAEAETILKPLFEGGKLGGADDKNAERNKRLYASVTSGAKADRDGELAKSEKEAATAPTGATFVSTGEAYIGLGDHAKAIELIQKGIVKGGLKPEEVAFAQLHLGIAQLKSGDKEAARRTWGEIKADNGVQELARVWTLVSRT